MIHECDVQYHVSGILDEVAAIRSQLPKYEQEPHNLLNDIEFECKELLALTDADEAPESEPASIDDIIDQYYPYIDMSTADDLRDAFSKILKYHGY